MLYPIQNSKKSKFSTPSNLFIRNNLSRGSTCVRKYTDGNGKYVLNMFSSNLKKLIERSRVCHNHKPQPTLDTKRKRKRTIS